MEAALILRLLLIKEKEEKECSPLAVEEIADHLIPRMRNRNDGMGRECVVKNEGETPGHRVRERPNPTGLGGEEGPPGGEAPARDG